MGFKFNPGAQPFSPRPAALPDESHSHPADSDNAAPSVEPRISTTICSARIPGNVQPAGTTAAASCFTAWPGSSQAKGAPAARAAIEPDQFPTLSDACSVKSKPARARKSLLTEQLASLSTHDEGQQVRCRTGSTRHCPGKCVLIVDYMCSG